jgi:hypothetical protein
VLAVGDENQLLAIGETEEAAGEGQQRRAPQRRVREEV